METYNIIKSESFKEGVKKLRKEHKKDTLIKLGKIINELVEGKITKQYHNHPLTNIKGRVYDLHVEDNIVLIYRFLGGAIVLSLELLDLIDHDTLMSNNYIKKLNKKLKEDTDIYETKNNSKVEQIDNLIEDIYNLRKEGMEEDGEYSIKNLIFKEFRNLGYLDNLKELRKKEISKELSLEYYSKDAETINYIKDGKLVYDDFKIHENINTNNYIEISSFSTPMPSDIRDKLSKELSLEQLNENTKNTDLSEAEAEYIIQIVNKLVKEDLTQEINYQTLVYTTIGSLSYYEDLSDIPYENIVKAYVPYILFENTPYKVYYTDMWGYTGKDYLIAKKETSLKEIFEAMKADFEEQEEELSKKDFEDHVFTVDKNANYVNVKID